MTMINVRMFGRWYFEMIIMFCCWNVFSWFVFWLGAIFRARFIWWFHHHFQFDFFRQKKTFDDDDDDILVCVFCLILTKLFIIKNGIATKIKERKNKINNSYQLGWIRQKRNEKNQEFLSMNNILRFFFVFNSNLFFAFEFFFHCFLWPGTFSFTFCFRFRELLFLEKFFLPPHSTKTHHHFLFEFSFFWFENNEKKTKPNYIKFA